MCKNGALAETTLLHSTQKTYIVMMSNYLKWIKYDRCNLCQLCGVKKMSTLVNFTEKSNVNCSVRHTVKNPFLC